MSTAPYKITTLNRDVLEILDTKFIPGLITDSDKNAMCSIVRLLPVSGKLVEVGTFLGKSASIWAYELAHTSRQFDITCIDPFNLTIFDIFRWLDVSDPAFIRLNNIINEDVLLRTDFLQIYHIKKALISGHDFSALTHYDFYKCNIANIKNVRAIVSTSIDALRSNNNDLVDISCVFEDGDHSPASLEHTLPLWWDRLLPNGILCGHDYRDKKMLECIPLQVAEQVAGVAGVIDAFAALHGKKVDTFDNSSIWMMQKL